MLRILFVVLLALCLRAASGDTAFDSGSQHVSLLELFTSEGCSSCPPAETWLSSLGKSDRLWKEVVPVSFHVDYWDSLGWKDRFAKREYTLRQESYGTLWGSSSTYTPGFVFNGTEWKGWFTGQDLPLADRANPGRLRVVLHNGKLEAEFDSAREAAELHCAALAMDVRSSVRGGENRGRELKHDFVAVALFASPMQKSGDHLRAILSLPPTQSSALACWVTAPESLVALQATGGLLNTQSP